ncbi:hypothetical protein ACTU6V_01520 [Microbacterium sp. A204]|uniref:hypothetical protein n=1 Tax=Microbacterium sp. A204 TaxID=3457321 RepID=UPI003FD560FA
MLPRNLRIGSVISIIIYAFIAFIAWERVGASSLLPAAFTQVAMWVVFTYFALGIVMNAISRSKSERYTMTPVVAVLAIVSLLIAMGLG